MTREEAINEVRTWAISSKKGREVLETLIPELKENEDERIKGLQNFLWRIANGEMNDRGTMPSAKMCQEWIAYLERQKDSKWSPSESEMGVLYKLCYISNQVTDEDDTNLTRLYQDLKREYFNGHSFENMFPSEKQKEPIGDKANRVIKAARRVLNNWLDESGCSDVSGDFTELEYAIHEYDGDEKQKEQNQVESEGPHYTKRNALFDKCVENCDPDVMKKVSNEVDEMLQKEHEPIGTDFRAAVKNLMNLHKIKNEFTEEDYDFHAKELLELVEQKEQKPVECIEFDNEFEKQVSHLLASVLNGEWEYNEDFVKYAAQSLLGFAKNEMKPDEWDKREKLFRKALQAANARIGQLFEENQKLKEQKLEKYAQRLQKEQKQAQTSDEKEYIRTIKSIISDFIRDKKPENLAYYQRIYDWLDGRHVPFSCGHENGEPADPVFSKQEYESHPIISTDTTSVKPVEFDGKTLLYTADKSYQIGFRDGVASVKSEWSEEDEGELQNAIDALEFLGKKGVYKSESGYDAALQAASWLKNFLERFNFQLKPEWSKEDEKDMAHIIRILDDCYAYGKHDLSKTDHENLVNKLKSLRPSWKPSEEQKEALEYVIRDYREDSCNATANYLQEILDHLKNM